jgi:hypothetical protein
MAGNRKKCSNEVYQMPATTTFMINDQKYEGSKLFANLKVKIDPRFQAHIHWIVNPKVNFTELEQHPLAVEDLQQIDKAEQPNYYTSHPMTYSTLGLAIFITALAIFGITWCVRTRRGRIVSYRPMKNCASSAEPTVSARRGPDDQLHVTISTDG